MYCPHCALETQTTDVCQWCKKPIARTNSAEAPDDTRTTRMRVALTGEIVADAPPEEMNRTLPVGPPMRASAGPLPPRAVTPYAIREHERAKSASLGERWELSLAIALPLLAASILLIHFQPTAFLWVSLLDMFVVSVALGATGAIPSYDDAILDCSAVLIVSFLLGPLIGLGAYFLVGLVKQEWNAAIVAVLVAHIAIRFVLILVASASSAGLGLGIQISAMGFLAVALSFAGWILSSFFRPLEDQIANM